MRGVLLVVLASIAAAAPPKREELPGSLREWAPWVLHGEKQASCPFFNGAETRECVWPGRLALSLDDRGGRFNQSAKVFGDHAWVRLPGAVRQWPQSVQVDGRPAIVVEQEDGPSVLVPEGTHEISGHFEWDSLPEALEVPPATGLVSLTVKGLLISQPNRDAEGGVFLQKESSEEETDRVEIVVNRRVTDDIPLTVTTQVQLKVSGKSRELFLGRAVLEGFVPMSLNSPFPLKIEPDGRLRVQIRPGTWVIEFVARHDGPVESLHRPEADGLWAEDDETWVFEAQPWLRQVLVEGVNGVDPQQTSLPAEWRRLPAYAMGPKDVMQLSPRSRGDSEPAPDALRLTRMLWLDFEGTGYTVSDAMTGQLHRSWRLDVQPGTQLGRVVASGADQSITRLSSEAPAGVELRQGALAIEADSRLTGPVDSISAVSWDADFDSVQTTLQLPPGWSLISVSGADSVPGTWVERWSLLDIFLVLVLTLAIGRLFGVPWGVLAFFTLALTWHEDEVPQYVWLAVLAGEALVRVLPGSWFKTLMSAYRLVAWGALIVITVFFMVDHVRHGMYPALAQERTLGQMESYSQYSSENEAQYQRSREGRAQNSVPDDLSNLDYDQKEEPTFGGSAAGYAKANAPATKALANKKRSLNVRDYDKNAMVQTGPGLPRWEWKQVAIGFSGPVQRAQRLSLFLIGPKVSFVLAFVRVLMLGLLLLCVLGFPGNFWPPALRRMLKTAPSVAAVMLVLLFAMPALAGGDDAEPEVPEAPTGPSAELLAQLKARLLEKPDCAPSCASSPRLMLEATASTLRIRFEVLSGAQTAVPLPGQAEHWLPDSVLLDGKPAAGLVRDESGTVWLQVSEGAHQVILEGALPLRDTVQVPLLLKSYRVEAKVDGWTLDGLHEDGVADSNLQLSRKATNEKGKAAALQTGTLPSFVRVQRELVLGLTWSVETNVQRLTPTGSAVVLEVPLLAGESITSSDVRVQNGKALVNMPAGESTVSWSSVLESKSPIALTAPAGVPWVEVWKLDVSPIWHVQLAGIPVVHQQDASGVRLPEWRPWPGEKVSIDVVRPEGVAGQTLTIDQSSLDVTPGVRSTEVRFTANMRSSRGGLQTFSLPDDATLTSVTINGSQQPIRQEGHGVSIPLLPGSQSVLLGWKQSSGQTLFWETPSLEVGAPTVNAEVRVHVPSDRWVLFLRGPRMGPAVLFWSFLLVLLLVSLGLARVPWAPLKTRQWVLLALGLSQVPIAAIAFVFGWLVLLGWRKERPELSRGWFNLRQLALVGVTVTALIIIGVSVYQGLLGHPEMQIRGNGSTASLLQWFQDRTESAYPRAWVVSLPMTVYRLAMLAWSLWMALALLRWLTWGWQAFSTGGLWRSAPRVAAKPTAPPTTP